MDVYQCHCCCRNFPNPPPFRSPKGNGFCGACHASFERKMATTEATRLRKAAEVARRYRAGRFPPEAKS